MHTLCSFEQRELERNSKYYMSHRIRRLINYILIHYIPEINIYKHSLIQCRKLRWKLL